MDEATKNSAIKKARVMGFVNQFKGAGKDDAAIKTAHAKYKELLTRRENRQKALYSAILGS